MNTLTINWKVVLIILAVLAILVAGLGGGAYWHEIHSREVVVPVNPVSLSPKVIGTNPQLEDLTLPSIATGNGVTNPWDDLNNLHQRMDQLFNNAMSQFPIDDSTLAMTSPNLDLREEKDHYTVRVDMPGADKSSLNVSIDDGRILRISADRTTTSETKDQDKVIRSERSMSHFERTVELPGPVKNTGIDAKYDNGVLNITLPKAVAGATTTKVDVH